MRSLAFSSYRSFLHFFEVAETTLGLVASGTSFLFIVVYSFEKTTKLIANKFDIDLNIVKLETDYWKQAFAVLSRISNLCPFVIGRIDIQFKHWVNSALELELWGENPDPYIERGWRIEVYPQITNAEPTVYHSNIDGSQIRTFYNEQPRILYLSEKLKEEYVSDSGISPAELESRLLLEELT
ncbi:MAG: hypothetical protein F6J93_37675 [Oscillatoria sp. SIO1A7]|nr:hypothetical protein [Oscillatoria sp. SIO1A7]